MSMLRPLAFRVLVLACVGAWLASCTDRKAAPTPAPFEPTLPFKPVKTSENKSDPGHALYVKHCYQCHQQAHPATLSVEKWRNKVPLMAKHAGISDADGKLILDYILRMKSQGVH